MAKPLSQNGKHARGDVRVVRRRRHLLHFADLVRRELRWLDPRALRSVLERAVLRTHPAPLSEASRADPEEQEDDVLRQSRFRGARGPHQSLLLICVNQPDVVQAGLRDAGEREKEGHHGGQHLHSPFKLRDLGPEMGLAFVAPVRPTRASEGGGFSS